MEGTSCVRGRVLYIRGPGNLMYINDDMFCHSTNIHVTYGGTLWRFFIFDLENDLEGGVQGHQILSHRKRLVELPYSPYHYI